MENMKIHKFHHKVLLGLAAIAVIAGVVYVSSQTKGQVAGTCEPKTYELGKVTGIFDYTSNSGDILTYDGGSKLITNSPTGGFSTDGGINWSQGLDLTVFKSAGKFSYGSDPKANPTNIQTFTDVTFDGTSLKFTTEYCAPCVTRITLTAGQAYTTPLGIIDFDGRVLKSGVEIEFSSDNRTWVSVYEFAWGTSSTTIYLRHQKTGDTFSLTNFVFDEKVGLSFDVPCVVPPPCIPNTTEKVTLSSTAPTYTLFDGSELHLSTGIDIFTLDSTTNEFSLASWLPDFFPKVGKFAFDQSKVPFTLYVKNIATGVVTEVTVVAVDTTAGTLTILAPVCGPEFTANLRISVEKVVAGSKRMDVALEVKVFNVENGAVEGILTQPQNYAQIYNKTTAENTGKETLSCTAGDPPCSSAGVPRNYQKDLVSIGANKGNKLVIVQSEQNTDGSGSYGYMGFDIPNLLEGQSRDVGFNIVPGQDATFVQTSYFTQTSNGVWQSARRAQVVKGSELQVFQPDDIIWTNGTEIYPFLFISDSDWTIDVCLEVPAGYQVVAPGTCGQTLIANETKVMEFKVADVGSPKEFKVKTKMSFTHKGKKQNLNFDVKSHNPKGR